MASQAGQIRGGKSPDAKTLTISWDDLPPITSQPDVIPEGWMDRNQYAEKFGCCLQVAARTIKAYLDQGKLEARDFKVQSGKSLSRKTYYRPKG